MDNASTPCLECVIKEKEYSEAIRILDQRYQNLRSKIILTNNLILQYNTKCHENDLLKRNLKTVQAYAKNNRADLLQFLTKQPVVEKEIQDLKNEVQRYKTLYENESDEKNGCLKHIIQLKSLVEQQTKDLETKDDKITSVNYLLQSTKSSLSAVKKKRVKDLWDAVLCIKYLIKHGGKGGATCRRVFKRLQKELGSIDKTEYSEDEGIFSPDIHNNSSKEGIFWPVISNSLSMDVCFAEDLASVDSGIHSKEESVSEVLDSKLITPEPIKKPSLKKIKKPQSKSIFDIDENDISEILTESNAILKEGALKPNRPLKCTKSKDDFLKLSSIISVNPVNTNKNSNAHLLYVLSPSSDILDPDTVKDSIVEINVMQTSTSSYESLPLLTSDDVIDYKNEIKDNAQNRKKGTKNGMCDPEDGVIILPEEQSASLGPDVVAFNSPMNLDKESDIDQILRLVKNDLPLLSPLPACSANEELQSSSGHEVRKVAVSTMTSLKLLDVSVGTEDFQFRSHAAVQTQELRSEDKKKILMCSIVESAHPRVRSVGVETVNSCCLSLSHSVCKEVCVVTTKNFTSQTDNIRPVRTSENASQTENDRPVKSCENASQTENMKHVKSRENASQTENMKPVKSSERASQTENMRLVKSCENASQTENMKPVKSRENAIQTEKMESLAANARSLQHAPVACICNQCEIHGSSFYTNRVVVNRYVSNVGDRQVSTKDSIAEEKLRILSDYMKYKISIQEQWKNIEVCLLRSLDISNKEKVSENLRSSELMTEVVATTSKSKVSNGCEIVHSFQENGEREQEVKLENESGGRESHNMLKKSTWNKTKPDRNSFYRKPPKNIEIYCDTETALSRLPSQERSQSLPLVPTNIHIDSYKDTATALSNPSFHPYSPITPEQHENIDQVKTPSENATESQISSNSVNSSYFSASTQVSCAKPSHNNDITGTGEQDSNLKYPIDHERNEETSSENLKCPEQMWQLRNEDSSDLVGNEYHKSTETKTPIPEGGIRSKSVPRKAVPVNTSLTHVDLFGSETDSDTSSDNYVNLNKRKIDVHCYNDPSEVTKRRKISIFDEVSNDTTSACSVEVSQQNNIPKTVQQQNVQLSKNKCPRLSFAARKLSKLQKMKRDLIKAKLPSKISTDILEKSPKRKQKTRSSCVDKEMNYKTKTEASEHQKEKFTANRKSANMQNVNTKSLVPAKGSLPVSDSKTSNECTEYDRIDNSLISEDVNNESGIKGEANDSFCIMNPSAHGTSINQNNSAIVPPAGLQSSTPNTSSHKKRDFVIHVSSFSSSQDHVKIPVPLVQKEICSDLDKVKSMNDGSPMSKTDRKPIEYDDLFYEPTVDLISPIKDHVHRKQPNKHFDATLKTPAQVLGITSLHSEKTKEIDFSNYSQICASTNFSNQNVPIMEPSPLEKTKHIPVTSFGPRKEKNYSLDNKSSVISPFNEPSPSRMRTRHNSQNSTHSDISIQDTSKMSLRVKRSTSLPLWTPRTPPQRVGNKPNSGSPSYALRERRTDISHDSRCTACTNDSQPSTSPHSVRVVLKISSPPSTPRRKSVNTTSDSSCPPSPNISTRNTSSDQHSTPKRKLNASDGCGSNSSSPSICGRVTRSGVHSVAAVKIHVNTIHPGGIIRKALYSRNFQKLQLNNKLKAKTGWPTDKREEKIAGQLVERLVAGKGDIKVLEEVVKGFGRIKSPTAGNSVAKIMVKYVEEDNSEPQRFPPHTRKPFLCFGHQQLIALIYNLEKHYKQYTLLHLTVLSAIEYILFRPGHGPPAELTMPLTRFYAALCRLKHNKRQLQVFCYDALYCFTLKSYAMILTACCIYPEFFPKADKLPGIAENLFVKCLMYEVGKPLKQSKQGNFGRHVTFDKKALLETLQNKYCYKNEYSRSEFLTLLMNALKNSDHHAPAQLENVFIIFGKRMEFQDSYKLIIRDHFYPLLIDWRKKLVSDVVIERVIRITGLIVRCYPTTSAKASTIEVINELRDILLEEKNGIFILQINRTKIRKCESHW